MTTERDVKVMDELTAAIQEGRVTTKAEYDALCKQLRATDAHRFSVSMTVKMPWRK